MSLFRRASVALGLAALAAALVAVPVAAAPAPSPGAVYVLSNQTSGNAVIAFDRAADGTLSAAGTYATGGTGTGGGLGSQGAVIVDAAGRHLYAVNAGSSSISSFRIGPSGLSLVDVEPSGGTMPTSLTTHGGTLYALNAGGTGNITGFSVDGGELTPLAGSTRGLSGTATSPAQVSFTPDGTQLIVSERATNLLDVYAVDRNGMASGPTTVASAGPTPFGFGFDNKSHLIVSEAFGGASDASSVSSYRVTDGGLELVTASATTTETAACWIATTGNGKFAYAGNAGTNSISGYRIGNDGALTLLDADGKTATAPAGVTDLATSVDSQSLYARLGDGSVGGWSIAADGSLSPLGSIGGLPRGAAGIASR